MNIRFADASDFEVIYELTNQLEEKILDEEGFRKAFDYALKYDIIHVLEEEGEALAFIHMRVSPQLCRACDILEIRELCVNEKCRSKGYGKILLQKAEEYAKERGISEIEVLSSTRRKRAHRFYEANGFEITGYRFFNREK